jgi:hypothetical protein
VPHTYIYSIGPTPKFYCPGQEPDMSGSRVSTYIYKGVEYLFEP